MSAAVPRPDLSNLLVVLGPSGVGKGTVIAEMLHRRPEVWLSVSTTTREPRPGEREGVAYFFTTPDEFQRVAAQGGFLEWARYANNYYGTALRPVVAQLAEGRPVVLEIDLEGARQVRAQHPEALFVFLAPPDEQELRTRLTGRGTESRDSAERRLARAAEEMEASHEFDAVVVNADVGDAVEELLQLWDRRRA